MISPRMTMVVARYNENLDWLKTVPWDYIVFNKGEDNLPEWIKTEVELPNIGREAHTYLTYIIESYDNLPDYIIFVQGDPFVHSKKLTEKINNFDGSSDFFPLSDKTLPSNGSGEPNHPGLKISESARIFLNNMEFFESPMGAQFMVSKKAILFHTKMTYQKIMESMIKGQASNAVSLITAHGKWYGKNCHRRRKNCECLSVFSPWVMERLWKTLFDSEHKTIYDKNITMVVARYNENLDWLKTVPWDYIVFNKGEDNLPEWIKTEVELPNIGREAHSYLTYIIVNYDNLADYTIFVQGNPFEHTKDLLSKINGFDWGRDFFTLSDWILSGIRFGTLTGSGHKVIASAQKIFVDNIAPVSFPKGAQFILSKKAILFHKKLTYRKLLDLMAEKMSPDEICLEPTHRRGCPADCERRHPFSPWVMERLWMALFDVRHKTIYD